MTTAEPTIIDIGGVKVVLPSGTRATVLILDAPEISDEEVAEARAAINEFNAVQPTGE